jgi:hypothetical protein
LQRLLHDAPHFCGRKGLTETRRSNLIEGFESLLERSLDERIPVGEMRRGNRCG